MTNSTLAPYSQEAEESTLGAVMNYEDAFHSIALYLKPEDFYIFRHGLIWRALTQLAQKKIPFDFTTIVDELRVMDKLNDIGGPGYLLHLISSTPTSMNAEVYGRMVQRTAVRRRGLTAADEIKALMMDEALDLERVLSESEKRFQSVRDTSLEDDSESLQQIINRLMGDVEARMLDPEKPVGIPMGFFALDEITGGLHSPDLTIIAARPGMGKTALILNIALNAARLGVRVGIASQEMDRNQIVQRLVAMESGVNSHKIRLGRLEDGEWSRFVRACGEIGKLPIFVEDANRLTPNKLRTKCLRWRGNHGLDLLIVDYLQILSSGGLFRPSERTAEVGYFARELKQLARELRIPVIAAAQLSRSLESRQDKRPMLSDLRESGEIEQEADLVHFIYRDILYNDYADPHETELITAKHRNGALATNLLHFENTTTRFTTGHRVTVGLDL